MPKLGKLMGALILAGVAQVALDVQDVLPPQGGAAFSVEKLGVRRLCEFQGAQDAQVRGQGAQVEHVDGNVDLSGFGSSCSRCSRCFWSPRGAAAAEQVSR